MNSSSSNPDPLSIIKYLQILGRNTNVESIDELEVLNGIQTTKPPNISCVVEVQNTTCGLKEFRKEITNDMLQVFIFPCRQQENNQPLLSSPQSPTPFAYIGEFQDTAV